MAPPHTMPLAGRADWALMTAIHDAPRRAHHPVAASTASGAAWSPPTGRDCAARHSRTADERRNRPMVSLGASPRNNA